MINGLTMTLKPISMHKSPLLPSSPLRMFNLDKSQLTDSSQQQSTGYELLDSSLTVRQNEEFLIMCTVESSRPAAEIRFDVVNSDGGDETNIDSVMHSLNSNSAQSYLTLSPAGLAFGAAQTPLLSLDARSPSVIESSSTVTSNSDNTFKTVHTARLKVSREDHGKKITCKAENGFSNQKWENKKLLNVLCEFLFY